jgi:hypothetical protein
MFAGNYEEMMKRLKMIIKDADGGQKQPRKVVGK